MLAPLTSPPREVLFSTYDFEWDPATHVITLCGAFDGEEYRHYPTMADFLEGELSDRNVGRVLFAHAGGSFDIQFILEHLSKDPSYRVEASFSGSSAVLVRIMKGRKKWLFGDSFFLLKSGLQEIRKWIGNAQADKDAIWHQVDMARLIEMNEDDCRSLWKAIYMLQETLLDLGGELKYTLASCAMALFRRKYLQTEIRTSPKLNEACYPGYYASRVEVFERTCEHANYYDINSSFPYSMTKPQPANVLGFGTKIPTGDGALYMVDCDVRINECRLPPIPYRDKDFRILFPTGRWRAKFDCTDFELLQREGHTVEKVHRVVTFDSFTDLGAYVAELYERKRTSEGFAREVFKLLLNALYGKFGERTTKEKILFNPEHTTCQHKKRCPEGEEYCLKMIVPGIWRLREDSEVPHAHVPISAHITALSRLWLHDFLKPCKQIYYCDTDSILCDPETTYPESDALGALKLEYFIHRGHFVAPKLYSTVRTPKDESERAKLVKSKQWEDTADGRLVNVKSKGFRKLTYAQYLELSEGKEIEITRMMRLRENLGSKEHSLRPRDVTIGKRIVGKHTKRRTFADGSTRAWTIDELKEQGRILT